VARPVAAAPPEPIHGWTALGHAVHGKVTDHIHGAEDSAYQRFNKRFALALTAKVGTMTTFWLFCGLAVLSLPAVLAGFAVFHSLFPHVIVNPALIALVAWVAQTLIQLVLLPALMVGQNLQNEASDARSAKSFEDLQEARKALTVVLDRVDETTKGGITAILDRLDEVFPKTG